MSVSLSVYVSQYVFISLSAQEKKAKTTQRWKAVYPNKEADFARLCPQDDISEDAFQITR